MCLGGFFCQLPFDFDTISLFQSESETASFPTFYFLFFIWGGGAGIATTPALYYERRIEKLSIGKVCGGLKTWPIANIFIACIFTNSSEKGIKLVNELKSSDKVKFRPFMPRKNKYDSLANKDKWPVFSRCVRKQTMANLSGKIKAAKIAVVQSY